MGCRAPHPAIYRGGARTWGRAVTDAPVPATARKAARSSRRARSWAARASPSLSHRPGHRPDVSRRAGVESQRSAARVPRDLAQHQPQPPTPQPGSQVEEGKVRTLTTRKAGADLQLCKGARFSVSRIVSPLLSLLLSQMVSPLLSRRAQVLPLPLAGAGCRAGILRVTGPELRNGPVGGPRTTAVGERKPSGPALVKGWVGPELSVPPGRRTPSTTALSRRELVPVPGAPIGLPQHSSASGAPQAVALEGTGVPVQSVQRAA